MRNILLTIFLWILSGCGELRFVEPPTFFGGGDSDSSGDIVLPSQGLSIEFQGTPEMVSLAGYTIPVFPEMKVTSGDDEYEMYLTGRGTRVKRVVIFNVNVYLAASYVAKPTKDMTSSPLDRVLESPVEMMVLTLVRDVSGTDFVNSVRDSLTVNGIDPDRSEFTPLWNEFSQGVSAAEQVMMLSLKDPSSSQEDVVMIRSTDPSKEIEATGESLGWLMWHPWFGTPVDNEMGTLKNSLIGQ